MTAWTHSPTFPPDGYKSACGNPPYYYAYAVPLSTASLLKIDSTASHLVDNARQFDAQSLATKSCPYTEDYMYYTASTSVGNIGLPLPGSDCDVGSEGGKGSSCSLVSLMYQSPVVTVQTSQHGTNATKILTDEGGLVGGILFATWFFGIFLVYDVEPAGTTRRKEGRRSIFRPARKDKDFENA
jgi:hypothetical protein